MAQQEITVTIQGISPILLHNGQLANPMNPIVKEMKKLTSVRKKTDETHAELSRLEFIGSLYLDRHGNVIIPSEALESCIVDGAKKSKLGKSFKSAICVPDDCILDYGPRKTVDELWANPEEYVDVRSVKVGQSRVMRTRPIFRNWKATFAVWLDDEQVDSDQVMKALADAGRQSGLCDFRPKFGRFEVVA